MRVHECVFVHECVMCLCVLYIHNADILTGDSCC